jgi:molybdate transport repressor ModE-like protein
MATDNISKLSFNYKIWLETEDHVSVLGDGKWLLLKAIRDTGSLKAAVDKLGFTYRRTWNDLKRIEKKLGFPILCKIRGGKDGGMTSLTDEGLRIVDLFERFHAAFDIKFKKELEKIIS